MALGNKKCGKLHDRGFGLIETIVGVAVFVAISVAAYGGFLRVLEGVQVLRVKNTATNLANEQIEIIRNLPYADVGIVGGIPIGKVVRDREVVRDGITFNINTAIRNIDDPFDGQIGQVPNDLSPADYKLAELTISCEGCRLAEDFKYYARISPYALETTGNNGALFVQVLDANGQPLSGASVNIFNDQESPIIDIDEVTNTDGMFQLIDAPPGVEAYQITVTGDDLSDDYSTDQTYTIGSPENFNPNKPHANISVGQVTQLSFAIDKTSDLDIYTRRDSCTRIADIGFDMKGSKTIGKDAADEDIFKYDESLTTDGNGFLEIDDVEWDNYSLDITDGSFDLAGSSPLLPLELNPDSDQAIDLILTEKDPNSLLVKVIDSETGLPISGADVSLEAESGGATGDHYLVTGNGFLGQTDWTGGSGQTEYLNETRYFTSNNIDTSAVPGQITLTQFAGSYDSPGYLESSTFDIGTTTNFGNLFWDPVGQPAETGSDSVEFQIATNLENTATSTWGYVGPDGTGSSYYTSSGEAIGASHHGDRYLRYRANLKTADTAFAPAISNASFTFTTDCIPPGQAFFSGLGAGGYTLTVDHPGYQQYEDPAFEISESWADIDVILSP
jgi:type II secretory pathway pseudopilin PulG